MSKSRNPLTKDTDVLGVFNNLSFSFKLGSCEMIPAQGVRARDVVKIDKREGDIPKDLFLNDGRIMCLTVSKEKISNHLNNLKANPSIEKTSNPCPPHDRGPREKTVKVDHRRH